MNADLLDDTAVRPASSSESQAVRDAASVTMALIPFGLALGVTISATGFGSVPGILGAPLVYAGSAQLTLVTLLTQGAPLLATVTSAALVNARLLMYSAVIAQRLRAQPRWFRWAAPHFIIDPTILLAGGRPELVGSAFRRYWLALGAGVMVVWSGSVAVGVGIGPVLPPLPHLGLVGVAMFLALLVPKLTDRRVVLVVAAAAPVAGAVSLIRPEVGVIAGAVAGCLSGRRLSR